MSTSLGIRSPVFLLLLLSLFIARVSSVLADDVPAFAPEKYAYQTVTYCVDPDWMPYEAIRNNQHVGMSSDYMTYIGVLAELDFQLIKTSTWSESLEKLKSGECQVASMLNRSPERERYLYFTQAFFVGPNVLVSNVEQPFFQGYENIGKQVVGAVALYRQAEYIHNYYPNINLKLVENELAGLRLLAAGDIDLFVGSLLSINALIQKSGFSNLRIAGLGEPQDLLSMAVSNDDIVLLNKLNAAISQLPEWVHADIYKQWNNVRVIEAVDYEYLWIASGVFLGILLLGLWRQLIVGRYNKKLTVKNNQLQALQKELLENNKRLEFISVRDPLTNMFNRHFMQDRVEQEKHVSQRKNLPVCLLLIDIDFFKAVNDRFGHSAGDIVLLELARLICSTMREMDVAARWGGEEFIILCPKTTLGEAIYLARRLKNQIRQHDFTGVGRMTCSFGVAEYLAPESFVDWFDRTDKALYAAKNSGRDCIQAAGLDLAEKTSS
ncbi:diguanylate cyclase [Paraglaciecola sp.]|uniref:diguanylate cyclase n=1 Tax=Paraglaciecola sp. TaxID=1920173 RepID=UPI0030F37811